MASSRGSAPVTAHGSSTRGRTPGRSSWPSAAATTRTRGRSSSAVRAVVRNTASIRRIFITEPKATWRLKTINVKTNPKAAQLPENWSKQCKWQRRQEAAYWRSRVNTKSRITPLEESATVKPTQTLQLSLAKNT